MSGGGHLSRYNMTFLTIHTFSEDSGGKVCLMCTHAANGTCSLPGHSSGRGEGRGVGRQAAENSVAGIACFRRLRCVVTINVAAGARARYIDHRPTRVGRAMACLAFQERKALRLHVTRMPGDTIESRGVRVDGMARITRLPACAPGKRHSVARSALRELPTLCLQILPVRRQCGWIFPSRQMRIGLMARETIDTACATREASPVT
jgi:hypothetical protein